MMKLFPPAVQDFADAFCARQIERHEADYNPDIQFVRENVTLSAVDALAAILKFREVEVKHRRAFAIYLLVERRR